MEMDRSASAVWHGGLKDGNGAISTQSGVLKDTQYSFAARFENGVGTNPEELIAAAHAGCFTMALSGQLTSVDHPPQTLETTAVVTMEKTEDGPTVTKIHLTTRARVPNIEKDKFDELAKKAKDGCPISRLLKAAEITLDAQLV
jgi:lipoyl-dependent peroxiredoxin